MRMKTMRFFTVDGKNASTDVPDNYSLKTVSDSINEGTQIIALGDPENPDVLINWNNVTAVDFIPIKENKS